MSSPLKLRDPNAPTPTKWLESFAYVPNTTPIRIAEPPPLCTPDSHTKRVTEMSVNIDRTMMFLMRPFDTTPIQHPRDEDSTHGTSPQIAPQVASTASIVSPFDTAPFQQGTKADDSIQGQVDHPSRGAADNAGVKDNEPIVVIKVDDVETGVVIKVEDVDTGVVIKVDPEALKEEHKAMYKSAKEKVELLAHGGLEMLGRGRSGTASKVCSGFRYDLACTHRKTSKCDAKCFINSDFSVEFVKGHKAPTPHPTTPNAFVDGTGCPRYGRFRGLHASEIKVAAIHDTAAARTTKAKDLSIKMLTQKVKDKEVKHENNVKHEDGVVLPNPFEKPPPSRRSLRHWIHAHKGKERVDVANIGSCQQHVERCWEDKQKSAANPMPCEVKVVHTEQWNTDPKVAPKVAQEKGDPPSRKTAKTATTTAPASADVPPAGKRKAADVPIHNSIVILSTVVLMQLCRASFDASVDGTYRCAPARSTIADFGVFAGRSYIPCFLGILTGPRSGDTSEHWGRFMAAVRGLLGDWCPRSCVRDHAACLINALNAVFGACQQVVCYFHLRQCIRRRKGKMPALLAKYGDVMRIIDVLHYTIEENWALASRILERKLPLAFRAYFYEATGHGDGGPNEVWSHRDLSPGQCATNCACEMFHHTLRTDPEHFNGIMKPGYMTCMGLLSNTIGMISLQCAHPSAVGPRHYTEHGDTVALTRLRATWRAGIVLCDTKVLERTYNIRGLVFYFLAGGLPVTRQQVEKLQAEKGISASQYLKFHALRRATETECKSCVPFLKFGLCRHVFAVRYHVHGAKFVPHGVLGGTMGPVEDDSDVDSELGAADVEEADEESGSDPDEAEDAVQPAMSTQRSRRPAAIHNVSSF